MFSASKKAKKIIKTIKGSNGNNPHVSGRFSPSMTVQEFFTALNSVPNYRAKNIRIKLKNGELTIGEMSVETKEK